MGDGGQAFLIVVIEGRRSKVKGPEDGRQRTEDGGQRAEDGRQRTDDG